MAIRADRVGVRQDQVDIHGRVTSPSFLNELLEDLPEWTDMPVWVNGTEELLPSNNSVPVTSPILTDIAYPDIRRDNQYFTYRESPTPVDGLAKIKSIKGNTLVWNQLVQNGNFVNTSLWGSVRGTTSASNNILSYSVTELGGGYLQNRVVQTLPSYAGHKYFISISIKAEKPFSLRVNATGEFWLKEGITPNVWNVCQAVRTSAADKPDFAFGCPSDIGDMAVGDVIQFKDVMLVDLTKMGLDYITDPSDFTSLFSLPYYDYNQGTLLSFMGNGIKTVGKNLYNLEDIYESVAQLTVEGNKLTIVGTVRPSARFDLPSLIASGTLGKTFTLSWNLESLALTNPAIFCGFLIRKADNTIRYVSNSNKEYGRKTISATLEDGETIVRIDFNGNDSGTNYGTQTMVVSDIQLEIGSTATEFEPYTSSTLSLPISTYFPTGMKSAEDVYDELTPVKATVRIKSSDVGSLPWTMPTSGVFQVYLSDAHIRPKVLSAFFKYFTNNFTYGGAPSYEDGTGGVNPNNQNIYYKDNNYTSVDALKSAMSGKYLNYELATPVELPTMSFE